MILLTLNATIFHKMTGGAILEFGSITFFDAAAGTTIVVAVDIICRRIICTTHFSRGWWTRLGRWLVAEVRAWAGTYEKMGRSWQLADFMIFCILLHH